MASLLCRTVDRQFSCSNRFFCAILLRREWPHAKVAFQCGKDSFALGCIILQLETQAPHRLCKLFDFVPEGWTCWTRWTTMFWRASRAAANMPQTSSHSFQEVQSLPTLREAHQNGTRGIFEKEMQSFFFLFLCCLKPGLHGMAFPGHHCANNQTWSFS